MIGFLHPWVLAGLAAAGVPILLHLLARREPPTVVFPAVRYLIDTTREHRKRLKLQNWLLLVLRTLLVIALVLAAAGPTVPLRGVPGHGPSALVLVVDNSASSGATVGGTPMLARLKAAARGALARATPADAIWLLAADGVPRRGDAATLAGLVDRIETSPRRLDLGEALTLAGDVLAADRRPGEILLLTDLQASAVSPADPRVPLVVARPEGGVVRNAGVARLDLGPQPWSTDGGRVGIALAGDSGASVPVSVGIAGRPARQVLGSPGGVVTVTLPGAPSGWWRIEASLDPDELRLDDRRVASVRIAPLARADCADAGRFAVVACDVLRRNNRLRSGAEIVLGRLNRGAAVVLPPEDPAQLGALNRELAARGVPWSFGAPVTAAAATDSGPLLAPVRLQRRYELTTSGSGRSGVLVTVGGKPWLVRSGSVVLLGSRLDPAWTDLPLSARFMPFMDVLLNRIARGELAVVDGAPGEPAPVPDLVTTVRAGDRTWQVEGGAPFHPPDIGTYYLLAGQDTVGALDVNVDPLESRLARAEDGAVRRLWHDPRVVGLRDAGEYAFSNFARGDLRGPLLVTALLVGLAEVIVASAWRRGR